MTYINLTPRWTEILPTWLMMFEQAIAGDCTNPDLVKANAKEELRRMATAADNYNDLVAFHRKEPGSLSDSVLQDWLKEGRELQELARTGICADKVRF